MPTQMQMSVYLSFGVRDEYAAAAYFGSLPPVRRQEALRRILMAGLKAEGVDLDALASDFKARESRRGERSNRRGGNAGGRPSSRPTATAPAAAPIAAPGAERVEPASGERSPAAAHAPVASAPVQPSAVQPPAVQPAEAPAAAAPSAAPALAAAPATPPAPVATAVPPKGPDLSLARSLSALT